MPLAPDRPGVRASRGRRSQRAEPDPSTRERLLDVALEAFAELGYEGASTRVIAARARVNQGLIPYYFGSKEKLWREAIDREFATLHAGIAALHDPDRYDDRARLEALIRAFVGFVAQRPAFARLMNEEGKRAGTRMRWLADRHTKRMVEATREIVERAAVAGGVLDRIAPEHLVYVLVGAATQLFHQAPEVARVTGIDPTAPEIARAHADALVALFVKPVRDEGGSS